MLYGAELWAAGSPDKDVAGEKIHKFLRRLLGVPSGTSTMAVLAEMGRYPLRVSAAVVMLKLVLRNSLNRSILSSCQARRVYLIML